MSELNYRVEVRRITPPLLFQEVAEMTTGKPCRMSWNRALCSGHSIIRAEEYLIKFYGIPQCVANHLVRHIHAQPYVLSKRPDRGGKDFSAACRSIAGNVIDAYRQDNPEQISTLAEEIETLPSQFDRHAPTNMALKLNAEEIINISKVRLCSKASAETREVWQEVVNELRHGVDPDLAMHCVPTCVYRGGICPEPKSCGYNKSEIFQKHLEQYKLNFTK
ncbi:MAG: hypothetical protein HDS71_07585 [Bacteroidales bacterium]|nr:hypothetical protein [Bacteroidales bacterium]